MADEQEHDQIVERLRNHDPQALGDYLTLRRAPLLGYIERHLGQALRRKVEPDDVLQEVGADALRSLPQVDLSQREPFGWLCQIAERRIIDAHRRFFGAQKRAASREVPNVENRDESRRMAVIDQVVYSMTSASAVFSRNQRADLLREAMQKLPEEHREALRLRYVEGLPSKEIAQRLGKTDGAVRVLLTRSLDRLQKLLGPDAAPR